jgi:hypothetical protein
MKPIGAEKKRDKNKGEKEREGGVRKGNKNHWNI